MGRQNRSSSTDRSSAARWRSIAARAGSATPASLFASRGLGTSSEHRISRVSRCHSAKRSLPATAQRVAGTALLEPCRPAGTARRGPRACRRWRARRVASTCAPPRTLAGTLFRSSRLIGTWTARRFARPPLKVGSRVPGQEGVMTTGDRRSGAAFWRERLAPYAKPDSRRSALDVATSVLPYVALTALMYVTLDVSLLLTLIIAVAAAGFLVRTFIVFHDCAHGSFLRSRRANVWLGTTCGLLVYSPFHSWRHEHAVHHATSGDLDRRGTGDVETLTVAEYARLSEPRRLAYRLFRNPLVMLGAGPIWALLLEPRLVPRWARARYGRQIIATDVALAALVGGLCAAVGWRAVVLVQLPTAMLAGAVGIWMF